MSMTPTEFIKNQKVIKKTLQLGKIPYVNNKRKSNLVTLRLELAHKETCFPHLTIDLQPCQEAVSLSICGDVWNQLQTDIVLGGQIYETVLEYASYFPAYKTAKIVELWKRWHLNDMNGGTRKQRELVRKNWDQKEKDGYYDHYDEAVKHLKEHDLHYDGDYQYGTAWLTEVIPDDVLAEIMQLFGISMKLEEALC